MNETYMEALEQYELEAENVRKGRGAWICETDRGLLLLKEYRGTAKRLDFEDQVLTRIDVSGSLRIDRYVRNREGNLLTETSDGGRYVVKEWFADRECTVRDGFEVRRALSRLAMLHRQLRQIPFDSQWNMGSSRLEPPDEELARHCREMQKARNFIRGKRKKSEFELSVIATFDPFYEQAKEAAAGMARLWAENWGVNESRQSLLQAAELAPSAPGLHLCHGDLDQHHVLMGGSYTAVIEYNRMHRGIQAADLYRFMRKVMEKHGWNRDLGLSMMDAYERVLPMERAERRFLYYLFLYPEKYWKQLNFYYNSNKAWVPGKSTEKLRSLRDQQGARGAFLKSLEMGCGA